MSHPNTPYLEAASARIADVILDYCRQRVGRTFRADDLRRHVNVNIEGGCAPASADRVLRDLRQRGAVSYTVLDRAKSLYLVEQSATAPPQRDLFQEHPTR